MTHNPHICNIPKFILSRNTLPGIIYIGRIPTMEHDLLYTNIFHQPSYLCMYEKYILTTTRFPFVYCNDPYCNFFLFHTPGKQDHPPVDIHFQLNYLNGIHTEEVDLLKFKRNNDLPPWYPVFQIPYQIELKFPYMEYTSLV